MARGLIDAAVAHAAAAGFTVLTPNAELAAALIDALERGHLAAGHEVWRTPRIRDFSGWLRERHAERQLSDATLPRCLNDVEERELWREVIAGSEIGQGLLEPAGAARAARLARRALIEYGIPIDALSEYATDETLALLDWNQRFEARCRDLGCISADRLWAAPAAAAVAWIESPIWRPVARRWLESHAGAALAPPSVAAAQPYRCQAAAPGAELAAAAEWARRHLHANPDFRAWVCIPDLQRRRAEVHDAFDAALAPRRFSLAAEEWPAPHALAGGTPLSSYAPVRVALAALGAASGSVLFETFSALLRSPELQASAAEAGAAASLDVALREAGPDQADLDGWLRLATQIAAAGSGASVAAVARLETFMRLLSAVRGTQPMSRWVSLWMDAFEAAPWALRSRWSSSEFQAAQRLRELLASLATADRLFGSRGAAAAVRILLRAAEDTAFQVQTGVPAIWVSAQLTDPWLAYDGIWVSGCSEDHWPPPLDPIPLLPIGLQRRFGVVGASADAQAGLARDLQSRWLSRANNVVFSCADPSDGRATLSPLLPATAPLDSTAETYSHWRLAASHAPVFERLRDERAPAFRGPPERLRGVATLRAQSLCAFRGFAETRLSTGALRRPLPGFNQRERGDMLHHALEYVWRELGSSARLQAVDPDELQGLVNANVERAIVRQCLRRDPGARWRARELPRLAALLHKWLGVELLREPFEVERLEEGAQVARHGGLEFNVRIDRVDRLLGGGRVLLDYKTGVTHPDWRGERPDNPQLPVYALLRPQDLVAVAYGKVNASECGFVAEAERGGVFKPNTRPSTLEGLPNFAALLELWSRRVERIAGEFAAGHAAVAPTPRACATCHLQALCRISAMPDGEDSDA